MINKPTPNWVKVVAVSAVAATCLIGSVQPASADQGRSGRTPTLGIDLAPEAATVVNSICAEQLIDLTFTNLTDKSLFADIDLTAPRALTLSRSAASSYLSPGYTQRAPFEVGADGAQPGSYQINASGGGDSATTQLTVVDVADSPNLAFRATPSASSTSDNFPICGAVDGDRDPDHWNLYTGWRDDTEGEFPDWYQLTFDEPQTIGSAEVVTPPGSLALRDWDLQAKVDGDWVTVDSVRDNAEEVVRSTFDAVETTQLRLLSRGAQDGSYSALLELEVYAPETP